MCMLSLRFYKWTHAEQKLPNFKINELQNMNLEMMIEFWLTTGEQYTSGYQNSSVQERYVYSLCEEICNTQRSWGYLHLI